MSRAAKTGIRSSRRIVSALGTRASGAETAGADIVVKDSSLWIDCSAFARISRQTRALVLDTIASGRRSSGTSGTCPAETLSREADSFARTANRLTNPGFVNAHSHAFQRALRGRTEGGDFWAWRDAMLELADRQTSERVRTDYEPVYREMRAAGYTAVGEFHYLGFEQ